VRRMHQLGPRVTYEFLAELSAKRMCRTEVETVARRYARLDGEVLEELGGALAMSAAESIAQALGQASRSGSGWHSRCPAHQGRSASLAFLDGDRGLVVHCHAECPARDVYEELRRLDLLDTDDGDFDPCALERVAEQRVKDDRHRAQRIANALDFWGQAYPSAGTGVERYWRSRGLTISVPSTIRMDGLAHRERPAAPCNDRTRDACRARSRRYSFHLPRDRWLHESHRRTNKKCFGPVGGGAVCLGPVRDGQWLVVGEGVERTASAMQLGGLSPGWAALSSTELRNLVQPPEARMIHIAADNDESGVGQAAARDAAWLWQNEGSTVRVSIPPKSGTDFYDILNGPF
jgi:putative DNA primase/helicase